MSPLLFEMLIDERLRDQEKSLQQTLQAELVSRGAKNSREQRGRLRRRLGRTLISIGLRLDPEAEFPAAS